MPEVFGKYCSIQSPENDKQSEVRVIWSQYSCSDFGYYDLSIGSGPATVYPPLTVDQINELSVAVGVLWATAFMLRFIRRLIPR
jgi:hypothetical protein